MIIKAGVTFFSLLLLSSSVRAQFAEYSGIWQDINNASKYYSVQVNGERMVFVDLNGLESSGDTLRSAYLGDIEVSEAGFPTGRLRVLTEHEGLSKGVVLHMLTPLDAYVSWGCPPESENCLGIVDRLRRIF